MLCLLVASFHAYGKGEEENTAPSYIVMADNVFVLNEGKWTHDKNNNLLVCSNFDYDKEYCKEWRFLKDFFKTRKIVGIQTAFYGYRNYAIRLIVYTKD